jgi:hypothetical protein
VEGGREALAFLARGRKARTAVLDVGAGAGGELAASRLVAAERTGNLDEVEAEDVVQQEARTLERGEPLEQQHERDRDVVRELAGRLAVERFVDDRLGQPRPHIGLAPHLRGLHAVEAEPRHHGAEIAPRVLDRAAVGGMPAQVGVLHDVLGLGARAEHAIGEARQRAPMGLEARAIDRRHHLFRMFLSANRRPPRIKSGAGFRRNMRYAACVACVSSRSTGRVSPPMVRRRQAWPCPSAYFMVG